VTEHVHLLIQAAKITCECVGSESVMQMTDRDAIGAVQRGLDAALSQVVTNSGDPGIALEFVELSISVVTSLTARGVSPLLIEVRDVLNQAASRLHSFGTRMTG
jgi:hypothetical protein